MATVNIFVKGSLAIPISDDPIIICPVEDTGRNSVTPSRIARIIDSNIDMWVARINAKPAEGLKLFCRSVKNGEYLHNEAGHYNDGTQGKT
jgi:hypothetical protein